MIVQNFILPILYSFFKLQKINRNMVLFADAHHTKRPEHMDRLYHDLQLREYEIIELYSDYQKQSVMKTIKDMTVFMKLYAKAGFVVLCDNFLPAASCKKRNETTLIQLWHGAGAFKTFGYDTENDIPAYYKGNVYKNYDIVTVSASKCIEYFSSAMNLDKSVFRAIGISSTDNYFRREYLEQCKQEFYKNHQDAKDKKIVLWAPTFRGSAANPSIIGEDDINNLQSQLGDEWFVLIKYHPHFKKETNSILSTETLLPVVNLLITDYSSIIFDYSIFLKPIIFFAPDLEEYRRTRGFYLQYEDLPGPIIQDGKELQKAVLTEYHNYNPEKIKKFYEEYMKACDGKATNRMIEIMDERKKLGKRLKGVKLKNEADYSNTLL